MEGFIYLGISIWTIYRTYQYRQIKKYMYDEMKNIAVQYIKTFKIIPKYFK